MTVSTTAVSVSYAGNGVTTAFPITFSFGAPADLSVVLVDDASGVETPLVLATNYTVKQSANGTGTLTAAVAPATGKTLRIDRETVLTQPDSLRNQGSYYPETVERMFDRMLRQVQDFGSRALRIRARDFGVVDTELPATVPLMPLVGNAAGTGFEFGNTDLTGDMLLRPNLADGSTGKGASLVAIEDAASNFTSGNAEGALAELGARAKGNPDLNTVLRAMADGGVVKVVCIGDSITYGQLDSGGLAATPYPARLQALLREYYANNNITVVNKGIAGSTVQDMLDRFATDVTAEDPDLIVFNGGQNDCRPVAGITIANYGGDVEQYLNRCNPTPVVVMGVTPRAFENLGSNIVDFYRDTLRAIAQARSLPYIDANARFASLYKSRAYGRGRLSIDGAHLSLEGYRYLGDVVFCDAFVNDDLYIKPGQFKDVSGQWLFGKTGAYLLAGTDHQDAMSLTMGTDGNGGSAKLYLFVEDWDECDLVLHTTINCNTTGQQVKVTNISTGGQVTLSLSPKLAGGGGWYALDYPIAALRLRPGINNISLQSVTLSQWAINGFSVKRRRAPLDRSEYLASYNEAADSNQLADFFGAGYGHGGVNGFTVLRSGPALLSSGTKIAPICEIGDVGVADSAPRWRMRATVYPGDVLHFGQQSTNDVDYMPVYGLTLDGTNAVLKCRDAGNVQRTVATVAVAVSTSGTNIKLDINSNNTGWALHINDTLIYSETVPLSVGLLVGQSAASYPLLCNAPILRLNGTAATDVIRGESWMTYSDDKLHVISAAATDKAVTFA